MKNLGKHMKMGGLKMMGGDEPRGTREEMKERRTAKKQERSQKKSDRLIGKYDDQYAKKKDSIEIKRQSKIDKALKQYQGNKITDGLFEQKINRTFDKADKKISNAKNNRDLNIDFMKNRGKII